MDNQKSLDKLLALQQSVDLAHGELNKLLNEVLPEAQRKFSSSQRALADAKLEAYRKRSRRTERNSDG